MQVSVTTRGLGGPGGEANDNGGCTETVSSWSSEAPGLRASPTCVSHTWCTRGPRNSRRQPPSPCQCQLQARAALAAKTSLLVVGSVSTHESSLLSRTARYEASPPPRPCPSEVCNRALRFLAEGQATSLPHLASYSSHLGTPRAPLPTANLRVLWAPTWDSTRTLGPPRGAAMRPQVTQPCPSSSLAVWGAQSCSHQQPGSCLSFQQSLLECKRLKLVGINCPWCST